MCEKCKDNTELKEEVLSQEEEVQMQPFLEMPIDNIGSLEYDYEEFKKGLNSYSFYSGGITALINAGLTSSEALEIIINDSTIAYNLKVQKMTCDNALEIAKITDVKINNSQI